MKEDQSTSDKYEWRRIAERVGAIRTSEDNNWKQTKTNESRNKREGLDYTLEKKRVA